MKFLGGLVIGLLLIGTAQMASASLVTDFSWVPVSTTYSQTTNIEGIDVTLASDKVPFEFASGSGVYFNSGNDSAPKITLSFSTKIQDLRLYIVDLDYPNEYLTDFSTAPTRIDGNFVFNGTNIISDANDGKGNLYWDNINSDTISFTYERKAKLGIYLAKMEFTPVPIPSTLSLLSICIFSLGIIKRIR